MKTYLFKAIIVALSLSMAISSCKKKDTADPTDDDTDEQVSSASDQSAVSRESDQALDDANTAISASSFSGGRMASPLICGATIDSSDIANGNIIIKYDGTSSCINGSRKRSGNIKIHIPGGGKWKDANTMVTVIFDNYQVTRVSDGKTLTLSGTKYITNVSGGLIKNLTDGGPSVVHKVRGSLTLTFDDNTQRTWQIARKKTAQLSSGTYTLSIEGDTTVNGVTGVDVIGTNRKGNAFYTTIVSPIVFSTACDGNAISGQVIHKKLVREITVTFGVDQSGNTVSGNCPYGYKASWTNLKGDAKQVIGNY